MNLRGWRYQVFRDFLAEKATDPLLCPVASFRGKGEKDALQNIWKMREEPGMAYLPHGMFIEI